VHPALAYAFAVALPLAAVGVEHQARSWIENIPFVSFFVVVSVVASIGGAGPGLLSVALSALGGWWFQASSADPANRAGAVVGALVFVPAGVAIALLGALVRAGYREQEEAARELSAALRARDEFISVASHELKTPLTSLTLSVHKLSRRGFAGARLDEPSVARSLALIGRQAARLNVLVTNLLDVSRIEAGRLHLELRDVDLTEVVRDVTSRFETELADAGCALSLAGPPAVIGRWDRLRLEQVVTNLLSNAVKYGGGRPIEIAVSRQDGVAGLAVSDHGIGIDPKDQGRIFSRAERIGRPEAMGGLGFGLWVVREIVSALDGTVGVESALGQGTKFTVTLPVQGPGPARASTASPDPG
jgi:signal transduction histidine kinase